jgi:uncharacterized protein DUF3619
MNDAESQFARRLTAHLDRGAAGMRSGTLYRLQQARAAALAGVGRVRTADTELATAGGGYGERSGLRRTPVRLFAAVLLIAALGFGFQQWRAAQQVREFEELDLHLLASDLPIDAYLDRGFQNWLRTTFDY